MSVKVTVLMPVYNGERFVQEAITSVLRQTFQDFELLIVDDGSTDSSVQVIESIADDRVRMLRNPANLGLIRTLNRGLAEARGAYVARMDADDTAHRDRLAKQVRYLDEHPELALVGSWSNLMDDEGRVFSAARPPYTPDAVRDRLLSANVFIHTSVMFRRIIVAALGGYSETSPHAEDYELWLRLGRSHAMANIPELLMNYRVHSDQVSIRQLKEQRDSANAAVRRHQDAYAAAGGPGCTALTPIDQLTGRPRSYGLDYLAWAGVYAQMGNHAQATSLAKRAVLNSPLSWLIWRNVLRLHGNIIAKFLRSLTRKP